MPDEKTKTDTDFLSRSGNIIVMFISFAIGWYAWMHIFIPLIGAFIFGLFVRKTVKSAKELIVLAFAVQAGHLIWFVFGGIFTGQIQMVILDAIILVGGLTWLLIRPGKGPVILLTIYHVIGFALNLSLFLSVEFASVIHRALLLHLTLRVVAVILMFKSLQEIKRQKLSPEVVQAAE